MEEVVGRDSELEAIDGWLDRPQPSVLLIEGEAGIGKTTLWHIGVERARARGLRVLTCAAARSEATISFTALRDLLDDSFDDVADELPSPQRRALAVTLLREEPSGAPPEQGVIAVSFLTAVRALAAQTPTLLAIDDVQWLDPASVAPLQYALRRLDHQLLSILLARRTTEEATTPAVLSHLNDGIVEVLPAQPLSIGAIGRILHLRLGDVYPRPALHRLHVAAGGNPFFALELARALKKSAAPPRAGETLPVPPSLRELVHDRLGALPQETLDVLAFSATMSRPTLELVRAGVELDPAPALQPAIDAHVVVVEGESIRFSHALYAAAAYELTSVGGRRDIHRRIAEVVDDLEERARHLALATDGEHRAVAQTIEAGATVAFERGSPAVAAELAAEARRLTPARDAEDVGRRALAEIDYEFAAGDTAQASALLEELVAATQPGPERARLLSRKARIRHFGEDIRVSVDLLYQALAEAGDDDALRGEIEEGLAWGLLLLRKDLEAAAGHARSAARLAEVRDDEGALAEGLAAQALLEFVLGRPWEETMARALALEEWTLDFRVLRHPSFAYGYCLGCSDELDAARDVFEELEARARRGGDESALPSIHNHLAMIELLAGNWDRSTGHADEGYARALESGQRPTQASTLAKRALVQVRRGDVEVARATAMQALELADVDVARPEQALAGGGETAIWALGLLELSLGNAEEAHRFLGPMCSALLASGVQEPGEARCLPDEVEALVLLERFVEAEILLERLDEWALRLERPSTLAAAGHCRGLLQAARGQLPEAVAALETAAAEHERARMPFECARTLLALGSVARRNRQRKLAREALQRAHATFQELGAESWAARSRSELGRLGGRAPSSGELTPTEQRMAALVAEGKSNKEVAAAMVVSVHTVEAALTSIYRKLDVHSRTAMARKLAEPRLSKH